MRNIKRRKLFGITLVAVMVVATTTALARGDPFVLKEIVRGAEIHGANGLYFSAQDKLYIASAMGREIIVMDPLTGSIINRLGPEAGVDGPDDLIFGPDGSLYWTNINAGEVGRLTPQGIKTGQFVARGVNPITFSPDGRLFVALDFYGDGLYELDPNLVAPPRPIIVATAQNPFPLGFLNGFDFGPDGRLYGPLYAGGAVISIDVDSCENTSTPWIDCDISFVTSISTPAAAKFDAEGSLIVVDAYGPVYQVDIETGEKTLMVTLPGGNDNLAFDSQGTLYVSNSIDGSIARLLPSESPRYLARAGMILPGGVAVMPRSNGSESVFIADLWTLREFNGLTGQKLGFSPSTLIGPGLIAPMTVSTDGEHLVITSVFQAAVQVWDPSTGNVLNHFAMVFPLNAIRFQNDLVVADPGLGGVVWASTKEVILGQPNVYVPSGLAVNENTLWVADWATGIVWQIPFSGNTPQTPVPIAFGLASPEGLGLDLDGTLLVVEAGAGRLSRIDPSTSTVTTVADGLQLGAPTIPVFGPPMWQFNGVAVGPSGAIYITGDKTNVLYRIWPR